MTAEDEVIEPEDTEEMIGVVASEGEPKRANEEKEEVWQETVLARIFLEHPESSTQLVPFQ
ncbi:MAG: hypothetical protein A3G60_02225 [Candidatus Ryanbacteria bacterium RIFCSPLOWO2_12_FULL_47_9c]|uniref:Uncharacterized protein n=1 Tax=Candidatus Ryanbacteria bacterium RIFCSPLOWO2_12_FULL_47_9c TaxID=1802131 RepID=A0A1G2H1S1_9BACT|nr:MAG: hypothetical protein A3G60_02225 [Candidatus Ryanbacteria bacterium RIFCSPLOWO2_12_FULL_47_9c]